jgi:apolipoprotein N-acyltransferase
VLALAVSLTIGEWLRGHVLTGFPWNAFGYALSEPLALAQTASLIGLWGMTFLSVAIFASPAVLIDGTVRAARRPWIAPVAALLLLVAMGIFGAIAAVAAADSDGRQRQAAHHAAQPAAGRQIQLRRQGGGDAEISDAVGSRLRAAIDRRARPAS